MRKPRIIWLPKVRSKRRTPRPTFVAGAPGNPSAPPAPRPRRGSHLMAWLYGLTLALAGTVLWLTPSRSTAVVPVSANAYPRFQMSWFSKALAKTEVTVTSAKMWLRSAMPLSELQDSAVGRWDWPSLIGAGVADLAGTRLDSLQGLVAEEIPGINLVSRPRPVTKARPHRGSQPSHSVMAGLPGDGGRIWAVLGSAPEVGLYQTFSMQSFASEMGPNTAALYTREWKKTIVNVGWNLALDLHQLGIAVVQARVNNMAEGLLASDYSAYQTAQRLLQDFPSVNVLLDVQRGQAAGAKNTVMIRGQKMARVRLVVGTGKLLPDPDWQKNEAFAAQLKSALEYTDPGIMANNGIDIVPYRENQQLLGHDLIVEIGGPNNTMAEEDRSAGALAAALKRLFND